MAYPYKGQYSFAYDLILNWNSDAIGVYYCGVLLTDGKLFPHYIGRAIADGGIRNRLLQHLSDKNWPDVTHFGYVECQTPQEAVNLEVAEIARFKPKYNVQGKYASS